MIITDFLLAEAAAALMSEIAPSDVAGYKDKALAFYEKLAESDEAKKRLAEWDEQEQGDPTLEAARRALLPGLLLIESRYLQIVRQWPGVFRRMLPKKLDDDAERFPEFSHSGLPRIRPRGAPIAYDNAVGERYIYMAERQDIALGMRFYKDVFEGALPASQLASCAMGLAESFVQAEEILHANVLETGRSYGPRVAGDGQPLFSPKHPHDHGVYSNIMEPAVYLNQIAIERVAIAIRQMPWANGQKSLARPVLLVVPIHHQFMAERLMQDEIEKKLCPEGYQVLDYLEDPEAWFLKTTVHGLFSMHWAPFRLDFRVEGDSLALEGSQSYTPGYNNPRAIFASFPKGD